MNMLLQAQLRPVRGTIHVHTSYDDGSGGIEEVVADAEAAGLDYLVITDHHHPHAIRDGWHGRGDERSVLTLIGTEQRSVEKHDIVSLGVHVSIATREHSDAEALSLLRRMGAVSFIAHPQGCRIVGIVPNLRTWKQYDLTTYDGIEIWSYMHDWIHGLHWWQLPDRCRHPGEYITGPDASVLAHWDEQARRRRVAGIGASDTHGRKLPLGLGRIFPWARDGILPYRQNFDAFSHYALVPKAWGRDDVRDSRELIAALAGARGWICHDYLAPGGDFQYTLLAGEEEFPLGAETVFAPGQKLCARSPVDAAMRLMCRGEVVAQADGRELVYEPRQPGEYRIEALLNGRAWLYTNHIYLRETGHASLADA